MLLVYLSSSVDTRPSSYLLPMGARMAGEQSSYLMVSFFRWQMLVE
jgi:hypothetical protein